jgi:hypothetical protein
MCDKLEVCPVNCLILEFLFLMNAEQAKWNACVRNDLFEGIDEQTFA